MTLMSKGLILKNVNKVYNIGEPREYVALKNVSLELSNSGLTLIVGESGSGKSTYASNNLNTSDYLIIDTNISIKNATGYLDGQALRIHIDDEYYYPTYSTCNLFSDIGNCYNSQELKDGGALKFTVAKYLTPKGKDIDKTGIITDKSMLVLRGWSLVFSQ